MNIKQIKNKIEKDMKRYHHLCILLKDGDKNLFRNYFWNESRCAVMEEEFYHLSSSKKEMIYSANLTRLMILDQIEMIKNNKIIL